LLRLRRLSFFVRKTSRNQLQGMLCLTHVFELITERNDSMSITPVWDAATVEQAVAQVAAIRPAYASILGFYGPVFAAQAGAAAHTCPAAIQVDESALGMRTAEGFSLIEPAAFTIDHPAAATLLAKICRIAALSGEKLSGAGNALAQAMTEGVAVDVFLDDALEPERTDRGSGQDDGRTGGHAIPVVLPGGQTQYRSRFAEVGGATAHRSGTSRKLPCVRQRPHYRRVGPRGQPVASLRVLLAPLAGKAAGLPVLQQPRQRGIGILIQR
jgi:hypothetical protein